MTASEIVTAFEAGFITENEATEQGMVETLDDLYSRLSRERTYRSHASSRHGDLQRRHG
ncbi:hypothetical protein [Aureimonas jatrophae]|jgi:hypothetical protein|uniref:Uncharacterized protein n=1 Tax=Aureimonas jatrophae TaxID=1166073 RepID=A0A1H0GGC6_9HYPH|nr:hypothetical protein [Aureimonas jatrophae]MBB3949559.1 hypothetical protein [Aureimonas jatrophae]SDO05970.1 hypothetical protein SAMN05192530_103112 [Aureimonas jatrophae]